jgi:hypothetical protein
MVPGMVDAERVLSASSGERRAAMQLLPEGQELIRRAFHVECVGESYRYRHRFQQEGA